MLIHLKETGDEGMNLGTEYNLKTITTMDFGQAPQADTRGAFNLFPRNM